MQTSEQRYGVSSIIGEDAPTRHGFSSSISIRITSFYFL